MSKKTKEQSKSQARVAVGSNELLAPQIGEIIEYPKRPYRCPVCGGNGIVPNGFYRQTSNDWMTTSTV